MNTIEKRIQAYLSKMPKQKVELARKAPAILKDAQKIDDSIDREKAKVEKAFLQYRKVWQSWTNFLEDADQKLTKLRYTDLDELYKKLNEVGVNPNSLPEVKQAEQVANRALNAVDGLKSVYKKPQ
ncbi:MAG: hypothetical protein GOVbin150_40 [Prokaryotic dsDNA virus sp.]|nr:MAG: hypothetical protein GOVbin150_40 [Prokaryotic dsDNA virus sp.]|tara:strand:- start:1173 stop:1550 length:378 start_codon:yes stop_codon:yes gene_type:complete